MCMKYREEDIIRKLDEDRMTIRGKMRIVRQDREEIRRKVTQRRSKKIRSREKKSGNTMKRRRRKKWHGI